MPYQNPPFQKNTVSQILDLPISTNSSNPDLKKIRITDRTKPIQFVRQKISECIELGDSSESIIELLLDGEDFLPAEGYLFDYKRSWPSTRADMCKYARHIAAFHNVYGGYIFFGVEESEKNKKFSPCVLDEPIIDLKQFSDLIRDHLTTVIEFSITTHSITINSRAHFITVLHIPRRASSAEPVAIKRDLLDAKGKHIFKQDEIYLREGDNSVYAQQQNHWKTIYGRRENPYLHHISEGASTNVLENNLPDRSLIYGQFVGRTDELDLLWGWFGDDFSRVRVLAGEGGLGKTSIAYEFATDFCRTVPVGFDCVIWLTAKKKQFRAFENSFEDLGMQVFESTVELLRLMITALGATDSEIDSCPENKLPNLARRLSSDVAALFIIDDLDSLPLDEQKRAIEVCQQFSNTKSRFLFTTRKNITASSASSIEVKGFELEEFKEFVEFWIKRLNLPEFKSSEISRLLTATGGSPLFTESVLRLIKHGLPIDQALKQWSGHLGVDVRNAALKREIMQLGMQARKLLAIVATVGECSFSEIKSHSGFSEQTIIDAANELESLFLLSTPPIAKERRFAVSSTTRQLVSSLGKELISDFDDLVRTLKVRKYKSSEDVRKVTHVPVAKTMAQAIAQIADKRPKDALRTVEETNLQFGGKNPDLLSMRARALVADNQPLSSIRRAFAEAYDAGQRKEVFFDHWYRFEISARNWDGAIQIIENALKNSDEKRPSFWTMKLLVARTEAASQQKNADPDHAVSQIRLALREIQNSSLNLDAFEASESIKARRIVERLADLHWDIPRNAGNFTQWLDAFERQVEFIQVGDRRYETYIRAAVSFVGMHSSNAPRSIAASKLRTLLQVFSLAPRGVKSHTQFKAAYAELNQIKIQ